MSRLRAPRIKRLGVVDGLVIYLVSGERIRNKMDIDFTAGGNEAIYPKYNPKGEIWIDDGMHLLDRMATALHEIVERSYMIHRGWSYDRAHDEALRREAIFRRELERKRPRRFSAKRIERAIGEAPRPSEAEARRQIKALYAARY